MTKRGYILVETLLGTTILCFILFFIIDLSLLISLMHRFDYTGNKIAHSLSLSSGIDVKQLEGKAMRLIALTFQNELISNRLSNISVCLLNRKGKRITDNEILRQGDITQLLLEANLSLIFTPFQLVKRLPRGKSFSLVLEKLNTFHHTFSEKFVIE